MGTLPIQHLHKNGILQYILKNFDTISTDEFLKMMCIFKVQLQNVECVSGALERVNNTAIPLEKIPA